MKVDSNQLSQKEIRNKILISLDEPLKQIEDDIKNLRKLLKNTVNKNDEKTYPNFIGMIMESNFMINTWTIGARAWQKSVELMEAKKPVDPAELIMDQVVSLKAEQMKAFGLDGYNEGFKGK